MSITSFSASLAYPTYCFHRIHIKDEDVPVLRHCQTVGAASDIRIITVVDGVAA